VFRREPETISKTASTWQKNTPAEDGIFSADGNQAPPEKYCRPQDPVLLKERP